MTRKYYLVVPDINKNDDDELFSNKAKAIAYAKKMNTTDIMIFDGEKGDEQQEYSGQLSLQGKRI